MLNIISPEYIHVVTGKFGPFDQTSWLPSPGAPDSHYSILFLWIQLFSGPTCKWDHIVFVFFYLAYFIQQNALKV